MSVQPDFSPVDAFKALETLQGALSVHDELDFSDILDLMARVLKKQQPLADVIQTFGELPPETIQQINPVIEFVDLHLEFHHAFVSLCESFFAQQKVKAVLAEYTSDPSLFEGYLRALQLESVDSKHEDIMTGVWAYFDSRVSTEAILKIKLVILEQNVEYSLGIEEDTFADMRKAVADDGLYLNILEYLGEFRGGLSWEQTLDMMRSMVLRIKPDIWESLETILTEWKSAADQEFLDEARDLLQDEALYEEFYQKFSQEADEETVLEHIESLSVDPALAEGLKQLYVSKSPSAVQARLGIR
ncbi:uncharacterized protein BJ171DRAFT_492960 [Polychytrium aggregatum]|uniref:uncharacterized protein n=1 Tax=Polychytrium aggregatum TaxID=110093 RepID=UPI0022FDF2D7|nr:uncharacterized protein BJ171DRAFT_492960 [Polychytrium aggregatum]KAI9207527.1 hypothetical protein BJ171DRAFT_492960 [Polychytrium aggregatum]